MRIGLTLIFLAFPLLEVAVLIKVGQSIGFWWTVLLLIANATCGVLILQRQGLAAMRRMMQTAQGGALPIGPVVDSMWIVLAGFLLVIPGLLTDIAGYLLLIPPLRRAISRWLLNRMFAGVDIRGGHGSFEHRPGQGGTGGSRRAPDGGIIIDGEWERVDEAGGAPSTPEPSQRPEPKPDRKPHQGSRAG